MSRHSGGGRLGLLIASVILSLLISPGMASAGTTAYPCDNERLGFGVTGNVQRYDLAPLQAGWYVNWGVVPLAEHPAGLDFAQIIRTTDEGYSPAGDALLYALGQSRGSLWLIGNEPDCPFQDNTRPENYARVYHDAYHVIKNADPLAQVAIGGIVQATSVRLQWLDEVWNTYRRLYGETMPVDVWNLHTFVLREVREGFGPVCAPPGTSDRGDWGAGIPPGLTTNCGLWIEAADHANIELVKQQVVRFRTWMRDHGQQNKELVISEYGILFPEDYGYPYAKVRDFMLSTFDYFMTVRDPALGYPLDDYHLVQRWAWYSLDDISFESAGTTLSALMNPTTLQLTPLGQDFARYASNKAAQCSPYIDLQPLRFQATTPVAIRYGQTGTVSIRLEVRNQGTAPAPASEVRFWDGDPDAGGVLVGTAPVAAVPAQYQGTATATLDWTAPAFGIHTLVAEIDPQNQVAESREDNNRAAIVLDFGSFNLSVGTAAWELVAGPLRPKEPTTIRLQPVTVAMAQPQAPGSGLKVAPPGYRATWYDGNPAAGGQVIVALDMPAPASFGNAGPVPAQAWTPVMVGPRPAWLVVGLTGDAPETTLDDNRADVSVPATADFVLLRAELAERIPVTPPGSTADVRLRFQVANRGTLPPIIPLEVALWSGTATTGLEVGRVGLSPTADWTEILTWPGRPAGLYPYVAKVDPDNAVMEANEINNELAGETMVPIMRVFVPSTTGPARLHYLPLIWR